MAQGSDFQERLMGEENLGVRHHGISRASLSAPTDSTLNPAL